MTKEEILKVCRQCFDGFLWLRKESGYEVKDNEISETLCNTINNGCRSFLEQRLTDYVLAQNGIIRTYINDEWWYSGDKFVYPKKSGENYVMCYDTFKCLDYQYEFILKGWAFKVDDIYNVRGKIKCLDLIDKLNNNGNKEM